MKTFLVERHHSNGFYRLYITVNPENNPKYLRPGTLQLAWIASDALEYWYGFNVEIKTENTASIVPITKAIAKLDCNEGMPPQVWINQLMSQKYVQIVRHDGLGDYVLVDQYPLGDTWLIRGNDGYGLDKAIARTEYQAEKAFMKNAGTSIAEGEHYAKQYLDWINRGKPMEKIADDCPLVLPTLELSWVTKEEQSEAIAT